jgi:small basic protein
MENWIGVGIWIVLGGAIGLLMKVVVKQPYESPGHSTVLAVIGALGGVIGGMLGVGIMEFDYPTALSTGGMIGAAFLSALMAFLYRWGIRGWVS